MKWDRSTKNINISITILKKYGMKTNSQKTKVAAREYEYVNIKIGGKEQASELVSIPTLWYKAMGNRTRINKA